VLSEDDVSWTDVNLTWLKNKKIMWSIQLLQIDGEHLEQCQLGWRESYLTKNKENSCDRFNCYK
jgi:hypothetical protein